MTKVLSTKEYKDAEEKFSDILELSLIKRRNYMLKPFGKFKIIWNCSEQRKKKLDVLDYDTTRFNTNEGFPYSGEDEIKFEKYMIKHKTDVLIDNWGVFYSRMGGYFVEISHDKLSKYKQYLYGCEVKEHNDENWENYLHYRY